MGGRREKDVQGTLENFSRTTEKREVEGGRSEETRGNRKEEI